MRDIHAHILPGVDDGSQSLEESLGMLEAARAAGVTGIVCTPHVRDPYFDYDAMWDAFELLEAKAGGFPLQMGFEVNWRKLQELGMEWVPYLRYDGSDEFLLELPSHMGPGEMPQVERTVYDLQGAGCHVYIAHPERCRAIQRDVSLAENLVRMGCELVASADYVDGGRLGSERGPAHRLFRAGLYARVASDAHYAEHYDCLRRALAEHPELGDAS